MTTDLKIAYSIKKEKMKITPLISIIVPVYNTAIYLPKCIESIQRQTLTDLEIVMIDDGSTDDSLVICKEYALHDNRIKIIHKENGGLSSARNVGLDCATAPFVGFVDSDDYIESTMYEHLYHALVKFKADVASCGVYDVFENSTKVRSWVDECFVISAVQECKRALGGKHDLTIMPNKLFKKELFSQIRFPEGKITEDDFIFTRLLLQAKQVAVLTKPYYYYIHRSNSITTAKFSIKDLDPIEAYDLNYELIKDSYPELLAAMEFRKCWARFYALDKLYLSSSEKKYSDIEKLLISYLRKKTYFIMFTDFFGLAKKIGFLFMMIRPQLYKYILKQHRRTL